MSIMEVYAFFAVSNESNLQFHPHGMQPFSNFSPKISCGKAEAEWIT